jgi:hypothetical protein
MARQANAIVHSRKIVDGNVYLTSYVGTWYVWVAIFTVLAVDSSTDGGTDTRRAGHDTRPRLSDGNRTRV